MRIVRVAMFIAAVLLAAAVVVIYLWADDSGEPEPYVRDQSMDNGWAVCTAQEGWPRRDREREHPDDPGIARWFCDLPPRHPGIINRGPEDFWIDDPPPALPE